MQLCRGVLLNTDYNDGITADNIVSVLRGTTKTSGGLSFRVSTLTADQVRNQNPAVFIDYNPPKGQNSRQAVRCVELDRVFPSKNAAVIAMKENGYPPFIQRTLSNALETGGVAGGYHWELVSE